MENMANNLLVFAEEEAQKSLITMLTWFCLTFSDSNRNHLVDR